MADRRRNPEGLEEMLDAYIETALWSSTDTNDDGDMGECLDANYGPDDLLAATRREMRSDCKAFLLSHADEIGTRFAQAGHDFWLTRNRHGAGFWDGDWPQEVGAKLTDACRPYGGVDLYVWRGKVRS